MESPGIPMQFSLKFLLCLTGLLAVALACFRANSEQFVTAAAIATGMALFVRLESLWQLSELPKTILVWLGLVVFYFLVLSALVVLERWVLG